MMCQQGALLCRLRDRFLNLGDRQNQYTRMIETSNSTKVRLLYTVSFLDLFACSLVVPLLSSHLRSLGASHFTIGVLNSLYAGLQLLSGPVIGSWSDIRGHSSVLQLSLLLCSMFYFMMGATTAIAVIVLSRIGLGLMKHTQALCRTLLADIVPSKDQLATQSRLVSFAAIGFILGPAIGGHLAEAESGLFCICLIVVVFFWSNFVIAYVFFSESSEVQNENRDIDSSVQTARSEEQKQNTSRRPSRCNGNHDAANRRNGLAALKSSTEKVCFGLSQVVRNLSQVNWPIYWDMFALKFILGFCLAVHYQNFALMLKDMYDVSPKWIGYTISLQGLVSACTGFTTNWISAFYDHYDDESNLLRTLHAFGILTLSFMLLSVAHSLTFVVLFLVPLSAAGSMLRITTSEIILQRTAPNRRGSLIGSGQSMSSVARLLAPLCSGLAYDKFGFHGMEVLKIGTAAAGAILTNFLFVQQKQEKKKKKL